MRQLNRREAIAISAAAMSVPSTGHTTTPEEIAELFRMGPGRYLVGAHVDGNRIINRGRFVSRAEYMRITGSDMVGDHGGLALCKVTNCNF